MDRSAILERTPNMMSEEELRILEEEHNRRAEEQFRRLRLESVAPDAENTRTIGELYASQTPTAPAPVQMPYTSAADRLADYTPAPSQRTELFGNVEFKNGDLVFHDAKQAAPVQAPAAQNEQTVDEDVRPTRRTMDTLAHPAASTDEGEATKAELFAGLSSGTKTALIVVAAAVLLLIVAICICSSVLGSISADIVSYQAELGNLSMTSQALRSQIGSMTDPAFVDEYARTVLEMIRQ